MQTDIITLFKQATQEVAGYNLENLQLDTKLSELQLDSVAVMEIIGVVEQRLSIRFNDEDLSRLNTVRDLQVLVEKTKRA